MRKAFYYDSAIPPNHWLKITSLLWDKIYISPLIDGFLRFATFFDETKNQFLTKLYRSDKDLFDTFSPETHWQKIKEGQNLKEEYFDIYRNLTREILTEMNSNISQIKHIVKLTEEMKLPKSIKAGYQAIDAFKSYKVRTIEKANYFNNGFYNHKFHELFPQLDYFFDKDASFREYYSNGREVILLGVDALLPLNLDDISIPQIKDFRQLTRQQRIKFIDASEEILKNVMNSSDEEGFNKALRHFKDILDEKVLLLNKDYKLCKIKAGIKRLQVICLAVTGIGILFPISLCEPALYLSDVSIFGAEHFLEKRKSALNIDKETWGFLLPLTRIKG